MDATAAIARHWGSRLYDRRLALCLTQTQVVQGLPIPQPTYSRWERGECPPPDWARPLLAQRLRTSVTALFPYPDPDELLEIL